MIIDYSIDSTNFPSPAPALGPTRTPSSTRVPTSMSMPTTATNHGTSGNNDDVAGLAVTNWIIIGVVGGVGLLTVLIAMGYYYCHGKGKKDDTIPLNTTV